MTINGGTVRRGQAVFDSWWSHRIGRIVKVLKTRVQVKWENGETWTYDKAHLQFLKPVKGRK